MWIPYRRTAQGDLLFERFASLHLLGLCRCLSCLGVWSQIYVNKGKGINIYDLLYFNKLKGYDHDAFLATEVGNG